MVTDLAEAIRRGESAQFALRDALLEDGHEELAERLEAHNEEALLWILEQILDRE